MRVTVEPPGAPRGTAQARSVMALESALVELGALTVCTSDGPQGLRLEADFAADTALTALIGAVERLGRALGIDGLMVDVRPTAPPQVPVLWRRRLAPARVGPLTIVAADDEADPTDGPVVRIEPGMAFGTVGHATTTLCLEWLAEQGTLGPVLDVGTGTGILALAALALGAERAVALDVDAEARAVAAENARLNGVGDRMRVGSEPVDAVSERFPLVLANILTEPLVAMAGALVAVTAEGGRLLLSGVEVGEDAAVAGAYAAHGFRITERRERDGWLVLLLSRS